MKINIFSKKIIFASVLFLVVINLKAQTGLNFQGVARNSNNAILSSQDISIRLSILQGSSTGNTEYSETRKVTTNAQGLFTAVIGDVGATSTFGNFGNINWKQTPKFLKIEMDPAAGSNFITMGTTQFQSVAYSQFANSVAAENIVGVVPASLGGTGVNNLPSLKTALNLNNVDNTTDLLKPISTKTQTALDFKLNAIDTIKYTKQSYTDSALLTKSSAEGVATEATLQAIKAKTDNIDVALSTRTKPSDVQKVDGSAFTQPISGSISVNNLPTTQSVTGNITATISGIVSSTITGTVAVINSGTFLTQVSGGTGALTLAPAGSTNGTALGVMPATATGVRFYLASADAITFTIATSAPSVAPTVTFTLSGSGTGPNWDEKLSGGAMIYVTSITGTPKFRFY